MHDVESLEEWHERRLEKYEDDPQHSVDSEYVVIEFDNGETYAIVADRIAQARASEIEIPDHVDESDQSERLDFYESERQRTLENEDLLVEWAKNEMSWSEIERGSVRIFQDDRQLAERLPNADVQVRTLEAGTGQSGGDAGAEM